MTVTQDARPTPRVAPTPDPSPDSAARRWRMPSVKFWLFLGVIGVVGYLSIGPLAFLLGNAFVEDGQFSLGGFIRAYGDPQFGEILLNTTVFALGASLVSLVVGTVLAYVLVRTDAPFKSLSYAMSSVPLIIPGILYTVAWIFLASPKIGLLNVVMGADVLDVFSIPGMIWVEGTHLAPLVFLLMVPAFRSMDPSLEESALMSGATSWQTFRRVTLPLVRPALAAGMLIMVVRGFEAFEVPALLGLQNRTYVLMTEIFYATHDYPIDMSLVGALSMALLLIAALGLLLETKSSKGASGTITGKGFRPREIELGRARGWVGAGLLLYFALTIALPVLMLLWTSLLPTWEVPSLGALGKLSLGNYAEAFSRGQFLPALWNSLWLGVVAATVVMLLMAVASWLVVRTPSRWAKALDYLAFLPMILPGLILSLALLSVYLESPLPVYGTYLILLIAYVTRFMPYGIRYSLASMRSISVELEESAQVSGATWGDSFRRVVLPLLMPGLLAGWVYVFIVSFRELGSVILVYSPGQEVLGLVLWDQFQNGSLAIFSAIGVLMIAGLCLVVFLSNKLGQRVGVRG